MIGGISIDVIGCLVNRLTFRHRPRIQIAQKCWFTIAVAPNEIFNYFSTNKNAKPFTTWKKLNLPSIYFKKCHY